MKKRLINVCCLGVVSFVTLLVVMLQSFLAVAFFFVGLFLFCKSFQMPPWFSAPSVIAGIILFFLGDWFMKIYIPRPAWWRRFVDSHTD